MPGQSKLTNYSGRLQLLVVLCLGLFFAFLTLVNKVRLDYVLIGVFLELAIIPAILITLALPFFYVYLLLFQDSHQRPWYLLALLLDLLIVGWLAWMTFGA